MSDLKFTKEQIKSPKQSVGLLTNQVNDIAKMRATFHIPSSMYKMLVTGGQVAIVVGDNDKIYTLKDKIILTDYESGTANELTFFIEPGIVVGHMEGAINQIPNISEAQRDILIADYEKTMPGSLYRSPAGFITAYGNQLIRIIHIKSAISRS